VDPKKNIKDEKGPIPKPKPTEEITVYIGYFNCFSVFLNK